MSTHRTEVALTFIERRLERRFPGIHCRVIRLTYNTYAEGECLWTVEFLAKDRDTLINHGLPTTEQFELYETLSFCKHRRHPSSHDEFENSVSAYPVIGEGGAFRVITNIFDGADSRVYTKKLQTQVDRMLRPFIRGTWKPEAVRT